MGIGYPIWKSETDTSNVLSALVPIHTNTDARKGKCITKEVITANDEVLVTTTNFMCSVQRRGLRLSSGLSFRPDTL